MRTGILKLGLALGVAAAAASAQQITGPQQVTAGQGATFQASGSGPATLYVAGPGTAIKREIKLGGSIQLGAAEIRDAGRYIASAGGPAFEFYVTAAQPAKMSFLSRPSRVPVAVPNAISGSAFIFDDYDNLVIEPVPVKFELTVAGTSINRATTSKLGVAWTQLDSARKEGMAQFTASAGPVKERRTIQQTAADACALSMRAQREKDRVIVETAPVRDCSGNAVPDGTIVTFIQTDKSGRRSTVDARVKRGTARTEMPYVPGATIAVASGVVVGNEIRVGGSL